MTLTQAPNMTGSNQPVQRTISGLGEAPAPCPSGEHAPGGHEHGHGPLHLDQRTYARAQQCVHCGLCLPVCPTYTELGLEADSPRGRIHLIKGLADGKIEPSSAVLGHLDLCLDCRACETACPSGVVYHELIEEAREKLQPLKKTRPVDRLIESLFFHVFPYPLRLQLVLLPARLLQKLGLWPLVLRLGKLLPPQLQKMQQMLPPQGPLLEKSLDELYPANPQRLVNGQPRARVTLLAGCVGSVLYQHVNRQAIALLQHAGCEVIVPRAQQCCGAIHHHGGQPQQAQEMARANIDALLPRSGPQVHYIVTDIAGCGAMLKDYDHLLRDDPQYAARAKEFAGKVRDVSQVLVDLAPPPPEHAVNRKVTYHDACHLAHAQKVTDPPRKLLAWIKGLEVVPLPESDMCCGAAGTYNLSQPEMARDLASRKLECIARTGARICVAANVGCAMQIQSEAIRLGRDLQVVHPLSLLHEAYFGK